MTSDPDPERPVPDLLGPDLAVLFVGINPGTISGETGHHFARPGNRFWPVLHEAGFTPRRLRPDEQALLPALGLGITNLVPRVTASAAELSDVELRAGGRRVERLVAELHPRVVAFLGLTTYCVAYGRRASVSSPTPSRGRGPGCCRIPAASTRAGHAPDSSRPTVRSAGSPSPTRTTKRQAERRAGIPSRFAHDEPRSATSAAVSVVIPVTSRPAAR